MSDRTISFPAYGRPAPQGSKKAWAYTGKDGKARAMLQESSSKGLKPWRTSVTEAARDASAAWQAEHADNEPLPIIPFPDGPVKLTVQFVFARPKGHYGSGRNAHKVKPSAPTFPTNRSTGDISKLVRAVEDALTDAGIWSDDAQVQAVHASKIYAGDKTPQHAGITIEQLAYFTTNERNQDA